MPTCPMCGETKYHYGYDDGSVSVCYSCKNWGPPKDREVEELKKRIEELERRLKKKYD